MSGGVQSEGFVIIDLHWQNFKVILLYFSWLLCDIRHYGQQR